MCAARTHLSGPAPYANITIFHFDKENPCYIHNVYKNICIYGCFVGFGWDVCFFLYLLNTHFISLKASGKSALLCFLLRKKKFIIFFIAQLRMCVFAFVYSVH